MGAETIRRFYAAWSEGNLVELFCVVRDDVDLCAPVACGLPLGGRCRGRAQLETFHRLLCDGVRLSLFEVREVRDCGQVVVVQGRAAGVIRHTGRSFLVDWAHVFTLRQGRVERVRVFFERAALAQAIAPEGRPVGPVRPASRRSAA